MLKKLIILLFFFSLFSSNSYSIGTNKSSLEVGDYLVAKISNNENDYRVTKRFYHKIHKKKSVRFISFG